jgi:alkylation response protein AidB-like acyl-CoA dehydrogenase
VSAPDLATFREELRTWFRANLDPEQRTTFTEEDRRRATAGLFDAGLLHVTWPVAYGGRGLPPEYQTVFNEESRAYSWALVQSSVTVGICAATLLDWGSEEQKQRHLPRMLRGDEAWTQLLSEPGAGSDLAGITTRAARESDAFVLNGQKVWTSSARESDYALALVRTDPNLPKYLGLSMVVVDLHAPGVDIRPLRQMSGESHFNEVFLDDVVVPVENLCGELNNGWRVLNGMLTHERIALSAGTTGGRMDRDSFADLVTLARRLGRESDPSVRRALADLYIDQRLLDFMGQRMRAAAAAGMQMGPVGSIGKIGIARSARASAEVAVLIGEQEVLAREADDTDAERWVHDLLYFPMTAIAGGTTEIQKNTVAERVLGLPREAQPNRDVPFNQSLTSPRS